MAVFGFILVPIAAHFMDLYLKGRRNGKWRETILQADSWLAKNAAAETMDFSEFKKQPFYYRLIPFLTKKTIKSINDWEWDVVKVLLEKEVGKFRNELKT